MELSRRLAALAAFVPLGSIVADIGTDHAFLPIFLIEQRICRRIIATELNKGPYNRARQTLEEMRFLGKIDLRQGNGLNVLMPGEANVIVIAGMGGNTIIKILVAAPDVLQRTSRLILQPQADAADLRNWLVVNHWRIDDETIIEDGGRLYVVITAVPGLEEVKDPLLLELGPRLVEKREPLFECYIDNLLNKYHRMLAGLKSARNPSQKQKVWLIKEKIIKLRRWQGVSKMQ